MKWNRIEVDWQQLKGSFKRRWRKLTNVDVIAGNREQLAQNIEERYKITTEEAEKQLADWQGRQKEIDRPT
ncbi:MAG: CsbD family protein [Betaproteobacteria bacterium]